MRKFLKTFVLLAFVTASGASAASGWIFKEKSPVKSAAHAFENSSPEINSARNLYLNNCARCHGADGKSNTELGKKYDAPDLTGKRVKDMKRDKVIRVIKYGEDEMPGFQKKLNSKQIKSIAEYIRSL